MLYAMPFSTFHWSPFFQYFPKKECRSMGGKFFEIFEYLKVLNPHPRWRVELGWGRVLGWTFLSLRLLKALFHYLLIVIFLLRTLKPILIIDTWYHFFLSVSL